MKFFDVMVFDGTVNRIYRSYLDRRNAKKLVKELKKKGFKSHILTSKDERAYEPEIVLNLPDPDDESI